MDENTNKPIGNLFGIPIIVDPNLKPDEWQFRPNHSHYRSVDDLIRDLNSIGHPFARTYLNAYREFDRFLNAYREFDRFLNAYFNLTTDTNEDTPTD